MFPIVVFGILNLSHVDPFLTRRKIYTPHSFKCQPQKLIDASDYESNRLQGAEKVIKTSKFTQKVSVIRVRSRARMSLEKILSGTSGRKN
jgi:hypothetical protein